MKLLVAGAGGHAKVVIDAARLAGYDVVAALGDAGGVDNVLGVPVIVDSATVDADAFIVAVGDNARRRELFDRLMSAGMRPERVIHPGSIIAPSAVLGEGVFVAAGVVINPAARIGDNTILNTSATVDHDCAIGADVHIGPGAHLCGAVSVGDGSLVGVGAAVVPGVAIGAGCVIGAGAAVTGDIAPGTTAAGVPAREIR